MLTPIEIQDKSFKSGIGYDKRDVDAFLKDILANYELLYTKNAELEDKVAVLSEGISHYKSNEKSIQKALVLAQNVADEIIATANKKAQVIEEKAYAKSDEILLNSKSELNRLNAKIADITMKFENYKNSCRHFALAQIEMLDNNMLTPAVQNDINIDTNITSQKSAKPVAPVKEVAPVVEPVVTPVNETAPVKEVTTSKENKITKVTVETKESDNITEDFTVNIDFNDFEEENNKEEKKQETILSFDNSFAEVKTEETKTELADEFNIGINFSENTRFNPNDSIRYYEEQVSEKEDKIVKEAGINSLDDEFIFDDIDDDSNSIGIDFDFLNTKK